MVQRGCGQREPLRQSCPERRQICRRIERIQFIHDKSAAQLILVAEVVVGTANERRLIYVVRSDDRQNADGDRNTVNPRR